MRHCRAILPTRRADVEIALYAWAKPLASKAHIAALQQAILPTLHASAPPHSLDPFPQHFIRGAGGPQDQAVAGKFEAAHEVGDVARLHAGIAMVRDGAGALVHG